MKTIPIKHKDKSGQYIETPYAPVSERLKYFRDNFKGWSLTTKVLFSTETSITFRAIIKNQFGIVIATGTAQEKEDSSFINKTSYIENCETSAWGRALANLGIGIDGEISSVDEQQNAEANQDPASEEQQKEITLLLGGAEISGANKSRIINERYSYTPEIATACIDYLQANQKMSNIDTANGGFGQKEIIKKLDEIKKDESK